jgi:predicted AlkP superfamily phosphohydrolase/phosphomutase
MSAGAKRAHHQPRLVILGIDAGDPELMMRLADEGRLRTLARLRERGVWARIGGPSALGSQSAWPSIVSGLSAFDHGCSLRYRLAPGSYRLERSQHPPPFWSELPDPAGPVAVIDVPGMDPRPRDSDAQLFDWGAHPCVGPPRAEPPELVRQVLARFGPAIETDEKRRTSVGDRRIARRLLERIAQKGALCRDLLDQRRFETLFVVFGDAHAAGHRFRRYAELGHGLPSRARPLRDAITRVYEAIDAELETLIARAGDADLFLVSNQGIQDGSPDVGLTGRFCSRLGYQHQRSTPRRSRLLEALRRRLGPGSTSGDPYAGTDWSRTRAFPLPATYSGLIRINLRGREPEGCVAPEDYGAELDRIEADLRALVDAHTGEPAVDHIVRTTEAFATASPPLQLPDLFVFWRPRRPERGTIVHPRACLRADAPRFARRNHHTREGLVVAAGPSIRAKGDLGIVAPEHLAPAFRFALGRETPGDVDSPLVTRAMGGEPARPPRSLFEDARG